MGGCCCCSSRSAEIDRGPAYLSGLSSFGSSFTLINIDEECAVGQVENKLLIPQQTLQCPREEHEPLSSVNHGALSAVSSGLLVDTNLDTSTPDTYQAPPAPLPYDVDLASSQALPRDVESCCAKTDPAQLADTRETREANDGFETADCKNKTDCDHNSPKITEDEVGKPISNPDEEDACPICLEDYDAENPRIMTKCEHHFHLSCILEWMERSVTCAICDQVMMIDNMYGMVSPDHAF